LTYYGAASGKWPYVSGEEEQVDETFFGNGLRSSVEAIPHRGNKIAGSRGIIDTLNQLN